MNQFTVLIFFYVSSNQNQRKKKEFHRLSPILVIKLRKFNERKYGMTHPKLIINSKPIINLKIKSDYKTKNKTK